MGADLPPPELRPRFWETVALADMTAPEWEALCDGCGRCCTIVLEDEETLELFPTRVACKLLDLGSCQCSDYPNRAAHVPWCIRITPQTVHELDWLPGTCAYRRLAAGQLLPSWHWLISADHSAVHREGPSLLGRLVSETEAGEALEAFIIE